MEKLPLTTSGTLIRLQCSNFGTATFLVHRDKDAQVSVERGSNESLKLLKRKQLLKLFFAKNVYTSLVQLSGPLKAFDRQGVPNSSWVPCTLNTEYIICPTYPSMMLVPATATIALVVGSTKFRSKDRLPALTFYNQAFGQCPGRPLCMLLSTKSMSSLLDVK